MNQEEQQQHLHTSQHHHAGEEYSHSHNHEYSHHHHHHHHQEDVSDFSEAMNHKKRVKHMINLFYAILWVIAILIVCIVVFIYTFD